MNQQGSIYFLIGLLIFFGFGGAKTLVSIGHLGISLLPLFLSIFAIFYLISAVSKKKEKSRIEFIELLVQISIHLVKVDQHVDPKELEAIKAFFRIRLRFNDMSLIDQII